MYKRTLNYCFANLIWWSLSIYNHVSKATVWTHVVHKHFIWIRWLLIIEEHKTCWISITVFCICTKIFDEHPIKNMSYIFVIVLIFFCIFILAKTSMHLNRNKTILTLQLIYKCLALQIFLFVYFIWYNSQYKNKMN